MKVLIPLYAFYPSQLGGPCNTLYWIGKELVKKNIKITAVASSVGIKDKNIKFDKWIDLDSIKIKYCSTKIPKLSLKIIWNSLLQVPKSDVLLFSSVCYIPYFFIGLLGLLLNKKIVWSPRGELFVPALQNNVCKKIYFRLLKLIFRQKTIFNATSKEEVKSIYSVFGNNAKCVLIPNYMELPLSEKRSISDNYLLYVGRIAPIKALDNLINGLLRSENFIKSGYKLLLAGYNQGDYYESLKKIIATNNLSEKIIFLGNIEGNEKNKLYANAYFTFLVSHSENFGNVVIESMAQGTPVVASQGTPWQLLEQTNSGFWIKNDVEHIAECVDNIFQIPAEKYELMRINALNCCRKEFDIYANIDKWLDIIKN